MMKKKILLALLIVSTAFSCHKDDDPVIEKMENKIRGEWIWVESRGGFTGTDILTAEQSGISKTMKFLTTDTVEIFENDSLIHKSAYFLSREESLLLKEPFDFLTINYTFEIAAPDSVITVPMRYIIRGMSDTLRIDEDVYDGYGHMYIRQE